MSTKQKSCPVYLKKRAAYSAIRRALANGTLSRPSTCEKCGQEPPRCEDGRAGIQGHHHLGYDYPLDVKWLCPACHKGEEAFSAYVSDPQWRRENPDYNRIGANNPNAKLSDAQALAIFEDTRSAVKTAADYGVSDWVVKQIRQGKAYRPATQHLRRDGAQHSRIRGPRL